MCIFLFLKKIRNSELSSVFNNPEASIIYWVTNSDLTDYNQATQVIETDIDILKTKSEFSLTDVELKALFIYTADGAQILNPFTQSKFCAVDGFKHHSNMQTISLVLKSALDKMPPYEGVVYRHDDFNGYTDFLDIHKVGEIVHYSSFLSSSKFVDRYPEGRVQLTIQSKSGRDMSWISYSKFYPENEEEVLFPPITKFLVIDRYEKDGRIFITLLETL